MRYDVHIIISFSTRFPVSLFLPFAIVFIRRFATICPNKDKSWI